MQCPICLDNMDQSSTSIRPGCNHSMHTLCMLGAAQYDVRCPICRHQPKDLHVRSDDNGLTGVLVQLNVIRQTHRQNTRVYNEQRAQMIKDSNYLKSVSDAVKLARADLSNANRTLYKRWSKVCRQNWRVHPAIVLLKRAQQTARQRHKIAKLQFEKLTDDVLGPRPTLSVSLVSPT